MIAGVALVMGVASAFEVRGALEREREFRAAPACATVPVKASGCLWEQEFTVQTAETHRGKRNKSPEAELLLPTGKPWEVTFPQTDPVVSEMEPGDKVVGLIWHGQVVEVRDADGRRQQTSSGPVGWPEDRLGGALACISFGLTALVGGLWPLLARGKRRHAKAATVVRWHGVGMGATAILTLWAQAANDWPIWAIPAIWGPLALLILASTVAFALAALRGDLDDDTPSTPRVPPPSTGGPGGTAMGAGSGRS
ncbi:MULTISPECIES: hypothetical protein [unclassified Streptomyces]|uniref:hypothetical protein n=1 Tax=unclassified Streptomyces TaxID=2593676 RepID=UPI002366C34D|nr:MULTISPECIES: hypothetical protein [unclassified Streptomyces]MDF3140564.1 hypothetical protein [Streptomyces sp. T21Q-yed]WDF44368.1 hypothetical protein PBV52_50120 [Streptomyces sp. T12]